MKKILSFLLCFSLLAAQGQDLTVAAGQTKILIVSERTLALRKLILGDNSTVILPATMDGWTVVADDVSIGQNVKIIAKGVAGNAGANGQSGTSTSQECYAGTIGQNALPGANGTAGKKVELKLKIRSLGSLQVDATGGHGGNGGAGGKGGNGGPARCFFIGSSSCKGGAGGKGGSGGKGGNAAAGGSVKIEYKKLGNATIDPAKFIVTNNGGNGGAGGNGGVGGFGGAAKDCATTDQPAGQSGLAGVKGTPGTNGAAGSKSIATF